MKSLPTTVFSLHADVICRTGSQSSNNLSQENMKEGWKEGRKEGDLKQATVLIKDWREKKKKEKEDKFGDDLNISLRLLATVLCLFMYRSK